MAIHAEEFIRCTECDNPWFREEEQLVFRKTIKARESMEMRLTSMESQFVYKCTKCGHQLNK